jgi:hypothetical protein
VGLPNGTQWTISVNGTKMSSAKPTITIAYYGKGNLSWSVTPILSSDQTTRWIASAASGKLSIPSNATVYIHFLTEYRVQVGMNFAGNESNYTNYWVAQGGSIPFSVPATLGKFQFSNWTASSPTLRLSDTSSPNLTISATGSGILVANFSPAKSLGFSSILEQIGLTFASIPSAIFGKAVTVPIYFENLALSAAFTTFASIMIAGSLFIRRKNLR